MSAGYAINTYFPCCHEYVPLIHQWMQVLDCAVIQYRLVERQQLLHLVTYNKMVHQAEQFTPRNSETEQFTPRQNRLINSSTRNGNIFGWNCQFKLKNNNNNKCRKHHPIEYQRQSAHMLEIFYQNTQGYIVQHRLMKNLSANGYSAERSMHGTWGHRIDLTSMNMVSVIPDFWTFWYPSIWVVFLWDVQKRIFAPVRAQDVRPAWGAADLVLRCNHWSVLFTFITVCFESTSLPSIQDASRE